MKSSPGHSEKTRARRQQLLRWLERAALLIGVGGSLWLIWWSVNRLRVVQTRSAAVSQQVSRISTEIDLMQADWPSAKTQEVALRFTQAREQLFQDADALSAWRDSLQREAVPLALEVEIGFHGTRLAPVGDQGFTLMQARVDLAPAADIPSTRPPYQRVLDLGHQLVTQTQRLDLVELEVHGGTRSISQATAVVELWAMDQEAAKP